jgi:hypothetical protein
LRRGRAEISAGMGPAGDLTALSIAERPAYKVLTDSLTAKVAA